MQRVCTRSVTPTQFGKCSLGVKWDNLLFPDLSLCNTSTSTCTIHEKFCWCNACLGWNGEFIIRDKWCMFKTLWLLVAAFVAMIPAGNIVEKNTAADSQRAKVFLLSRACVLGPCNIHLCCMLWLLLLVYIWYMHALGSNELPVARNDISETNSPLPVYTG